MRASQGEIKIEEVLTKAGLVFEEEYSFPDLLSSSGHPLRFDFAVFDDDHELQFLIEYQGIQHYQPKRIIICCMFDKVYARCEDIKIDYVGKVLKENCNFMICKNVNIVENIKLY